MLELTDDDDNRRGPTRANGVGSGPGSGPIMNICTKVYGFFQDTRSRGEEEPWKEEQIVCV